MGQAVRVSLPLGSHAALHVLVNDYYPCSPYTAGVCFAVPLRAQVIVGERLKFPSGTASAAMIATLHQVGGGPYGDASPSSSSSFSSFHHTPAPSPPPSAAGLRSAPHVSATRRRRRRRVGAGSQVVQHQLECDVDCSASALDDCDSSSCSSSGEEGLAIMVDVDGVVGGVSSVASGGSSSGGASTTVLTP